MALGLRFAATVGGADAQNCFPCSFVKTGAFNRSATPPTEAAQYNRSAAAC